MSVDLKGRSFLKLLDFTPEEITYFLDLAADLKDKKKKGISVKGLHEGKSVALIFEKTSTRTRCSFEVAAHDIGAFTTYLDPDCSQIGKKESIADTARVLGSMYDGIEYRGYGQEIVEELAKYAGVPVWNGLTNEWHPTQMLADLLTIREHFGYVKGIKLTYMGDARYNMGNSLMVMCAKMGMHFTACTTKAYFPDEELVKQCKEIAAENGGSITLTEDVDAGTKNVDVIYVANPHAFHFDSVMKALENGKHVLCEKPAGVNMSQLTQMIKKAEVKELFFMEAMWTAFNPCVNKVIEEINSGNLGKVKHIESRFCNRLPYDPKSRMFAPELAGGALLDLGIYNIYFSMIMAQSTKIDAYNSSVRMYKGVDVWNSVNLSFDNGITASFQSACDMTAASETHNATIFCENGYITLHNFFMAQKARVHVYTKEWGNMNVVSKVIRAPFGINGYEYEMIEATDCILQGKLQSEKFKHEDSIKLCQIMDRLRDDWKMKYPFE